MEEGKKAQRMGGDVNGMTEGNFFVFGGVWTPKIMSDFLRVESVQLKAKMNEHE